MVRLVAKMGAGRGRRAVLDRGDAAMTPEELA